MKVIAIEEHVLPTSVQEALAATPLAGSAGFPPELAASLADVGEGRIAGMDAAGIDVQVLSTIAATVQQLEPTESLTVARSANDLMAEAVAAHPSRFRGFAALPLSAPAAAADELRRAVTELGLVGAMVFGHTRGLFLDHPSFTPVLETLCELDVPLYLHPAPPPPAVHRSYFSDLDAAVAQALSTAAWGWHAETGLHVLRLAASGTLDRHRQLRVIVGHMGENLPFSLARADQQLSHLTGLDRSVAETVLEQVWITTCGYTTIPPLLCALQVFGADRMLFSVDFPFSDNAEGTKFLREAPISPADRKKIAHANAEALLRLS